jgi:hypothetical protein
VPDQCQPIVDRIRALQAEKRSAQEDLRSASPSERQAIIQLARRIDVELRDANAELSRCRRTNPAPRLPDIRLVSSRCLDPPTRTLVEAAVTEAFADEDGVAHSACVDGRESLGIWIPAVGDEAGRRLALEVVPPRQSGEEFGLVVGRELIKRQVRRDWEARPKAVDDEGEPDTTGPVFLTNLAYRMEEPHRVVTTVEGFRRTSVLGGDVNLDFTVTITDDLDVEGGQPHCDTTIDVDTDLDILGVLTELFLGGPLGAVRSLVRVGAKIWEDSLAPDQPNGGVGCSSLALLPTRISLDDETSIALSYSRIEAAAGQFILAGGSLSI